MSNNINEYIVNTTKQDWQPLIEKGIHYKGIFVKSLRYNNKQQRSSTILLKFEAGASYPYHNHPAGEELFILQGEAIIEGEILKEGDFLYTPENFKHSVRSETGCTILFIVPEEVEIL
jgi:quercetin dioxygenase-like cupin family protein